MTSIRAPQIDMRNVIRRYSVQGDLTLERRSTAQGAFVDGRWNESPPVTASITANVQPLGMRESQALPEGVRERDGIVIYDLAEILPQGRTELNRGDIAVWKGVRYEVVSTEDWDTNGRYWRAVAVKVEQ